MEIEKSTQVFILPDPLQFAKELQKLGEDAPAVNFTMTCAIHDETHWSLICDKCNAKLDGIYDHQENPNLCLIYAVLGS